MWNWIVTNFSKAPSPEKSNSNEQLAKLSDAYKSTFASLDGQLVLEDLANVCGVMHNTFRNGDPHGTAFLEGRRDVALYILTKIYGEAPEVHTPTDDIAEQFRLNGDN